MNTVSSSHSLGAGFPPYEPLGCDGHLAEGDVLETSGRDVGPVARPLDHIVGQTFDWRRGTWQPVWRSEALERQ